MSHRLQGFLTKIDSSGRMKSRRRLWYLYADDKCMLYFYKSPNDLEPLGKINMVSAVFNFEPEAPLVFGISASLEALLLEADSEQLKYHWLNELQSRRDAYLSGGCGDHQVSDPLSSETASSAMLVDGLPLSANATFYVDNPNAQSVVDAATSTSNVPSEIPTVPGPTSQSRGVTNSAIIKHNDSNLNGSDLVEQIVPSKPNNQSHRRSFQMPFIRKTTKSCETCADLVSAQSGLKEKICDLNEELKANRELVDVMKTAVVTYKTQIESLKEVYQGDIKVVDQILSRDKTITELELKFSDAIAETERERNEKNKLGNELENVNLELENTKAVVDAQKVVLNNSAFVPETMGQSSSKNSDLNELCDFGLGIVEEAVELNVSETVVTDSVQNNDLNDVIKAYRKQNEFLNQEFISLQSRIRFIETERDAIETQRVHMESLYYQLKSKYVLFIEHVKNAIEPNSQSERHISRNEDLLYQLIDDASNALDFEPEKAVETGDFLGFIRSKVNELDPMQRASEYLKRSGNVVETYARQNSSAYVKWLLKWDDFLVNFADKQLQPSVELKELLRSGCPQNYRSRVWKSLIHILTKDKEGDLGSRYYSTLCRRSLVMRDVHDPAIKQIDLDLVRTLPENKYFNSHDGEKVQQLKRVLYAFRFHNPAVGYCQGLNRVAAVALLNLGEEDAFWCLVAIVELLQPKEYYDSHMLGAQADQMVLKDLVQDKLPKIAQVFKQCEFDLSPFMLNWFLTVFVDNVPHGTYLNIWDVFLYEGHKVLFRFALAALKAAESELMKCTNHGSIYNCMSEIGKHLEDYRKLAQIAFHSFIDPLPMKEIEKKRNLHLATLKKELGIK